MSRIPNVPKQRIRQLSKRIKPVVRFANGAGNQHFPDARGELHYIKPVDPFTVAFTWDPKPAARAEGLRKLRDITTYHTWAYYGFFKPSIAEVLAQIPEELLPEVVAFETSTDVGVGDIIGDYHRTTTTLYGRA